MAKGQFQTRLDPVAMTNTMQENVSIVKAVTIISKVAENSESLTGKQRSPDYRSMSYVKIAADPNMN